MQKLFLFLALCAGYLTASAQKVTEISFNLYTDSLKKGFYNYISVDGKLSGGNWMPLDSTNIIFTANTGFFKGNDLFIDSSYTKDSVVVKAALRANPQIWKETVIYIRKRGFDEPLKTGAEIQAEMHDKPRRKRAD